VKTLVTGADGFIGSHLVEALVKKGHEVRALAQYNSFNNWGWLESIDCLKSVEVICGDVRDPFFCKRACEGVEQVYNLAALIAIPYSYVAPSSYVDTNVLGALNICQAALDSGVSRVIQTSTSEVYGTAQYVPINEAHPLQPQSPYSASKIGADNIALSYHNAFELPVTVVRPFNTYGPRQSARAVIPAIISQIASGSKAINLGDTTPTRDFTYVKDTCAGFISHSDAELVVDPSRARPESSEVFRLWCDNKKLREATGFELEFTFEQGIQATIDWFSDDANLAKYKADIYNV